MTLSVHGSKTLQTIGLGGTSRDMHIDSLELQRMSAATGLRIASGVNGSVTVNDVKSTHSEYVYPLVTLVAQSDDTQVTFATTASTFHTLAAQADNGVVLQVDVTATTGGMYLDADYENSSSEDAANDVQFADGVRVVAETLMTLESTTGNIIPAAKLTLVAGSGVVLLDDMTTTATNSPLVMDVDYESEGDGTLTVWTGKTVTSNKSDVTITAWDVDLDGSLTAGTKTLSIHESSASQSVSLGWTGGNMHLHAMELIKITALDGFLLGAFSSGTITVNGITEPDSDTVQPLVSLIAKDDNDQVVFATNPSTFDALMAQADNGIHVQVDVTTDVGILTLDGDMDDSDTKDGHDKVAISGARTLSAIGQMTLDSTSGGIVRSGTATMTLMAQAGILINDDVTSADSGQLLVINADSNDSGAGTFTMATGQAMVTNDGVLHVTAADIDIQGTINTGTAVTYLHGTNQRTIGIGTTDNDYDLEADEVASITSTGIFIGDYTSNKEITVDGVTAANSNTITVIVTLLTTVDDSSVTFTATSSSFHTLAVQADNAVSVDTDITATTGGMYLDGDYENSSSGDTVNDVQFTDGVRVAAETLMTLESTTGNMKPAAKLTLVAGSGIVVLDDMTTTGTNSPLVMDVDYESNNDGTLTVWTGKTVTSNKSDVTITAWDVDMAGSLTAGTMTISVHGSTDAQTIGFGDSPKDAPL
jgi:hypothetical protein